MKLSKLLTTAIFAFLLTLPHLSFAEDDCSYICYSKTLGNDKGDLEYYQCKQDQCRECAWNEEGFYTTEQAMCLEEIEKDCSDWYDLDNKDEWKRCIKNR